MRVAASDGTAVPIEHEAKILNPRRPVQVDQAARHRDEITLTVKQIISDAIDGTHEIRSSSSTRLARANPGESEIRAFMVSRCR